MDSITQASLGAAVGHLCWNKEIGAKALVAGAVIGTIPDLDILAYPLLDQVQRLYWHRGESHSIFFVLLGGLVTSLVLRRYCFKDKHHLQKAFLGALLIYATHILIDLFTIYGTQLLAPVSRTGFGYGNFFIIDPLFTLTLLLGITGAAIFKSDWGVRLNVTGLAIASLYTIWSFSIQSVAHAKFNKSIATLDVAITRQMTTAAPFTTFLWRHLAETPDGFVMAYWSVFDAPDKEIQFHYLPKQANVIEPVKHGRSFQVVQWFSKGWWCVIESDEHSAKVVDLRFTEIPAATPGSHLYWNWPFSWKFNLDPNNEDILEAVAPNVQEPLEILHLLAQRIRGGNGWLTPMNRDQLVSSAESLKQISD
jgi:inner membrane protein